MRLYFFGGRQHGRKRALDLVAGQIAELQKRCEKPAAGDPLLVGLYHRMNDRRGCSEAQVPLLMSWDADPPCPAPDKTWLEMESTRGW